MFTNRTRVAFALMAIGTTACGIFVADTGGGTSIKTLFITAVGDTLHGLNRSYQFELVALDEDGEAVVGLDVTWSTSDAAVATVDQLGVVVTKAVGATQILAAVQDTSAEAAILVDDRAATIAGGKGFVCALDRTGAAYCWGGGFAGQLGDGSGVTSPTPVPVAGDLRFHSLSAGWDFHTCGLTTDGDAYCWGRGDFGALGDGTDGTRRLTPVPVAGDIKFKYLRTAAAHTCGVAFDGKAYCWGLNNLGQIGGEVNETCQGFPCTTVPVPVATDLTFTSISLRSTSSCGIATDGLLYCWGGTPTPVDTDVRFQYVRGAHFWQCGMATDDRVYCWASLAQSIAQSPTPTLVPDQPQFVLLSESNGGHICGLDAEGIAYCWGDSVVGGLGLGPSLWMTSSPVALSAELRFYAIGAGDQHTCAITIGFEVYCWGANGTGELGDGTMDGDPDCPDVTLGIDFICRSRPVRVLFDPKSQG